MKWQPARPEIAVPRGRRVTADAQRLFSVSWRRLDPADVVDGWVLAPLPTLLDCVRTLPFDEGLAIAYYTLRSGRCSRDQLRLAADSSPERGHAAALRVARAADGRAANPFESVLRAIALGLPADTGLTLVPQVRVDSLHTGRFVGRVDLADERLAVVAEADSFEFHGEAWQLDRDCRRYDELVVDGWLVLRFTWLQVMKQPEWVASMLQAATRRRRT